MNTFLKYFQEGTIYCQEHQYEKGIAAYNEALRINPLHTDSLYNRAKAKFKLDRLDGCLDDLNAAIAINPHNPLLFSERAVVFYHKGLAKDALNDLDMAARIEPENPYRYASRAFIKDKTGDFTGALEDYNKAISLDPTDAISYNNRGLVEEKLGYTNRSKLSFEKADRLTGGNVVKEGKEEDISIDISNRPKATGSGGKNHSLKDYLSVLKGIFASREGFKDFLSFAIDFFRSKKA
jgi:tetratricopeptide (TPR) repeat protein